MELKNSPVLQFLQGFLECVLKKYRKQEKADYKYSEFTGGYRAY
jgi:hypothetical protein